MDRPFYDLPSLLISLKGRVMRLRFALFTITSYAVFIALVTMWHTHKANDAWRVILHLLTIGNLPLKYIVSSKRFHDLNLSGLCASPLLILTFIALYNNYVVRLPYIQSLQIPGFIIISGQVITYSLIAGLLVVIAILLTDLTLMFIAGTRGTNHYGDDPRQPTQSFSEVF